jgi:hypothetical protein
VICKRCKELVPTKRRQGDREPARAGNPAVRGLLCERCGCVLPEEHVDDRMLRRLTQMAQFGIGAESGPLLSGDRR